LDLFVFLEVKLQFEYS